MFFSWLVNTQFDFKPILELWTPWSLDNPRSKLLFQMLRLEASLSQNFQNNFFSSEFINGLKMVLSWERYGYVPTLYICYGESALAYKDCHCGYHLEFLSCNHMFDLGRTWSRTHRLRAAIHLEAECNGHQERTRDLCGVPKSGPGTGSVWRTVSWIESDIR